MALRSWAKLYDSVVKWAKAQQENVDSWSLA